MSDPEKLEMALDAIVRTVDGGCVNTARNCYTCDKNTKCKVMFAKEALCMIHNGTKSMDSSKYREARDAYWRSQL